MSLIALVTAGLVFRSPAPASELVRDASLLARKENKNVLVIFHASWCSWCKRFDKFLDTTSEGVLVKSALVPVHVTVLESAAHKADENPGGVDLMNRLGGKDAGLPFMAILDAKTLKPLVNSLQKSGDPRSNTGYPAAPEEIAHFAKMLKVGAPALSADSAAKVQSWLTANAPK